MAATKRRAIDDGSADLDHRGADPRWPGRWFVPAGVLCFGALHVFALQASDRPPPTAPASQPNGVSLSPEVVQALVQQLEHPRFTVRHKARARLCKANADVLTELVRLYRQESRHERRLRLRYIIEYLYYRKLMVGQVGFLGIQPGGLPISGVFDPPLGHDVECVVAARVLKGFPAEQAGLKDGDFLMALDDVPIYRVINGMGPNRGSPRTIEPLANRQFMSSDRSKLDLFTAEIMRRVPGSRLAVRVFRCSQKTRTIEIAGTLDAARVLEGATFAPTVIPPVPVAKSLPVVLRNRSGLRLVALLANSPAGKLGLRVNDVVVAIDRQKLNVDADAGLLAKTLEAAAPDHKVTWNVVELQEHTIPVTLGARGVDMMNPQDMLAAQMRFAEWWHKQSGEKSIRRPEQSQRPKSALRRSAPVTPEPRVVP